MAITQTREWTATIHRPVPLLCWQTRDHVKRHGLELATGDNLPHKALGLDLKLSPCTQHKEWVQGLASAFYPATNATLAELGSPKGSEENNETSLLAVSTLMKRSTLSTGEAFLYSTPQQEKVTWLHP